MFTVKSQIKIAQKFDNIPDIKLNAIFREVEKETEGMIVERGFLRELRESLDHLRTWFDSSQLLAVDKEGNEKKTALCIVKNLHHLVSALILKHNIRRPRVVVGCDGGQGKLLCTLAIFDLDNPDLEVGGYQSGGTRRSLVIAAADKADENRVNLDTIFQQLRIWESPHELLLATDQKCANLLGGKQRYLFGCESIPISRNVCQLVR